MPEMPAAFLKRLSLREIEVVRDWWGKLPPTAQREVVALYDGRQSVSLPSVRNPFVREEDEAGWAEWHAEYFDHLISNPELIHWELPVVPSFHICTAHEAARSVVEDGLVPPDFACPFQFASCPMRRLLAAVPGKAVRLLRVSDVSP